VWGSKKWGMMMKKEELEKRRAYQEKIDTEYRDEYMRDECRVVHSFGFRRLSGKTQILGADQGDFHRNRMTHSIEVASICRSISLYIKNKCGKKIEKLGISLPEDNLITAVGLLHDIGHPPFGHGGEIALNYKMRSKGGFEANAQTLRLVAKIEPYHKMYGLNLTRRTLLGLLKYPCRYTSLCASQQNIDISKNRDIKFDEWKPPKCYYDSEDEVVCWMLAPISDSEQRTFRTCESKSVEDSSNPNVPNHKQSIYKSLDCSIMDIADDISYSIHDLEDAIYLKLIDKDNLKIYFCNTDWLLVRERDKCLSGFEKEEIIRNLFNICKSKKIFGKMVGKAIQGISIQPNDKFESPLLRCNVIFDEETRDAVKKLKNLIQDNVIKSQPIQTVVYGGMLAIMQLFDAMLSNPDKLLPQEYREGNADVERRICDYIAGMTDSYAYGMHKRLYGSSPGSVFDPL